MGRLGAADNFSPVVFNDQAKRVTTTERQALAGENVTVTANLGLGFGLATLTVTLLSSPACL